MPRTCARVLLLIGIAACGTDEPVTDHALEPVTVPAEPTTLVRQGSGKCLDVAAAGTANGTRIQQWTCNGTAAQTFTLEDRGGGIYRVATGPTSAETAHPPCPATPSAPA